MCVFTTHVWIQSGSSAVGLPVWMTSRFDWMSSLDKFPILEIKSSIFGAKAQHGLWEAWHLLFVVFHFLLLNWRRQLINFWTTSSQYLGRFFDAELLAASSPAFSPRHQAPRTHTPILCVAVEAPSMAACLVFWLVILITEKHGVYTTLTIRIVKIYRNHTKITSKA